MVLFQVIAKNVKSGDIWNLQKITKAAKYVPVSNFYYILLFCAILLYWSLFSLLSFNNQYRIAWFVVPKRGAAAADPCLPGEYILEKESLICSKCPKNEYAKDPKETKCVSCPSGWIADIGSASCSACSAGRVQDLTTKNVCLDCEKGLYQSLAEKTSCIKCPSGYVAPAVKSASCLPCYPGEYGVESGQLICLKCAKNMYAKNAKSTEW